MFARILALLFVISFSTGAHAGSDDAKKFVSQLGDKVLEIVKSKQSGSEKEQQLIQVFNENVNTEWMSKFVLGRYYKSTPAEKLEKYQPLYRDYVMNSYIPRFREYTGEKFKVAGVRKDKDSFIVQTEIVRPNNQPSVRVDYRLLGDTGTFKIVDIVVEGVSLITTQRSEFGAVITNKGFDVLVAKLQDKAKNKATAAKKKA